MSGAQDHAGRLAGLKCFLPTGAQRHQRSPGFRPRKLNSGIGVERSLPRDLENSRKAAVMTAQTVWLPMSSCPVSQQPSRKNPVMFIEQTSSRSPSTLWGVLGRPLSSLSIAVSVCGVSGPVRQRQPCRQRRTRPQVARRAVPFKSPRDARGHNRRRAARAAAPMSLLRWPHDHHRDLRARQRAEPPPSVDQDRHLMTLSPPIDGRPDTFHSCWLLAGSDQAHITPLDPQPVASPISLRHPSRSRDGHSGPADRTAIAMAERTRGEAHRFDPTGLPRPCRCVWRAASSPPAGIVPKILQ